MSIENATKFTVAAAKDPALAAEVSSAVKGKGADKAAAAFAALGKSKGYDFTAAEAAEVRASFLQSSQMSEQDLEKVAGGSVFDKFPPPFIGSWDDMLGGRRRGPLQPSSGGAPLGSNPATWSPNPIEGQAPLGSNPRTWSPFEVANDFFNW